MVLSLFDSQIERIQMVIIPFKIKIEGRSFFPKKATTMVHNFHVDVIIRGLHPGAGWSGS